MNIESFHDPEYTSRMNAERYKTMLVSLFLFRLVHDDIVEEFHLDSTMDIIGPFGEIYLKVKIRGIERPIIAFFCVSHNEHDIIKEASCDFFIYGMMQVKGWLLENTRNTFGGNFEDNEYLCVIFTNTRVSIFENKQKPYRNNFAEYLNNLIGTGGDIRQGVQVEFTEDQLDNLHEMFLDQEIVTLASHFATFLGRQSLYIMQDKYIVLYHILLAHKVVQISDIQTQGLIRYRELTFRPDFFVSDNNRLSIMRDILCDSVNECQRKRKPKKKSLTSDIDSEEIMETQISDFLSHPSVTTLSPLIEKHVFSGYDPLKFNVKRPNDDLQKLDLINDTPDFAWMVREAKLMAGENALMSLKLKVPITFGNIDLALSHNSVKRNRRLKYLTQYIIELCQTSIESGEYNIVTIDESETKGFLSLKGGIGSAIGNLFIYDEATKLLKFTENVESLQDNARALYDSLRSSSIADTLNSYRFEANTIRHFPKLLDFNNTEEMTANLNKLVLYEEQSNHNEVENILKKEIEQQFTDERNVSVLSDKIFMYCHSAIQQWWISKKRRYFNKPSDINI